MNVFLVMIETNVYMIYTKTSTWIILNYICIVLLQIHFFQGWGMLTTKKQKCILKLNFKSSNYGKNQTKFYLIFFLELYATVIKIGFL